jgi:hypothetical protein
VRSSKLRTESCFFTLSVLGNQVLLENLLPKNRNLIYFSYFRILAPILLEKGELSELASVFDVLLQAVARSSSLASEQFLASTESLLASIMGDKEDRSDILELLLGRAMQDDACGVGRVRCVKFDMSLSCPALLPSRARARAPVSPVHSCFDNAGAAGGGHQAGPQVGALGLR